MQPANEPVARYDDEGTPIGVAPRGVVYRDGLCHACTAVAVFSGDGTRLYVHRRTERKLLFPGLYDCWAGGVIGPGESPEDAAAREAAEELGVVGAVLAPLGRMLFTGSGQRYHVFGYTTRWNGPIVWQPEEVAWGAWVPVAELSAMLADPVTWPFVPDGRAAAERWLNLR